MPKPMLSIAMHVRNAAPYLAASVGSIFAQSFTDWELLAMDDGSEDQSLGMLRSIQDPRVRVFSDGRNLGVAARLNQIIREARGECIARFDADDLMHPSRFEKQLAFLDRNPQIHGLGCGLVILDEDFRPSGLSINPAIHEEICAEPLHGIRLSHPAFIARTRWWQLQKYNEQNRSCEDWELWFSAHANSRFANLIEPMYFYQAFSSFSLKREIRARLTISRLQWNSRSKYGLRATASESLSQFLRIGYMAAACALGGREGLILRRSQPPGRNATALYYSAIPPICERAISLFGREAVPQPLLHIGSAAMLGSKAEEV